jgi:hypothetical protein
MGTLALGLGLIAAGAALFAVNRWAARGGGGSMAKREAKRKGTSAPRIEFGGALATPSSLKNAAAPSGKRATAPAPEGDRGAKRPQDRVDRLVAAARAEFEKLLEEKEREAGAR